MRILLESRWPVVALLLLAPSIPELLTGSTPITELFFAPWFFALGFAGLVGLYGGGALLIREFTVHYQKGWASVLLLGAAYGIGEEGFAVHTFFEPSGSPVNHFATYGHAFGVNWLWALGLSIFHATYSIALPILLVGLLYPRVAQTRWLDRGAIGLTAFVYLFVVFLFAIVTGFGPSPTLDVVFLVIALVLIGLAWKAPRGFLTPRAGPPRTRPWVIGLAAATPFIAWTGLLIFASRPEIPAVIAGGVLVILDLLALAVVLRWAGTDRPEWTKFYIAAGMLGVLFVWDVILEFAIPLIFVVTAAFVYLLYRLRRTLIARGEEPPAGAAGWTKPLG